MVPRELNPMALMVGHRPDTVDRVDQVDREALQKETEGSVRLSLVLLEADLLATRCKVA